MNCQKCGSALNPDSVFCPVCGTRTNETQVSETNGSASDSPQNITLENFTPYINQESSVTSVATEELPPEEKPVFETFSDDAKDKQKKLSRGKKALIISGISILLIAIIGVVGYFLLWPKLAQEKIQEAINVQADTIAEDIAVFLDDLKSLKGNNEQTSAYKINAKLSDRAQKDVLNVIRKNIGTEVAELLNWVNDIDCDADLTFDGDLIQGDIFIRANEQDITPAAIVMDTKNNCGYLTLPDVNKSAIKFEFDSSDLSSGSTSTDVIGILYESIDLIPEKEVSQRILASYLKMLFAGIEDVEEVNDKYDANGIKADSTCYQFKITSATLTNNFRNILEDIKKNKDIENILTDAETKFGDSDIKTDFYKSIDDALAGLSEAAINDEIGNHLLIKIWVDDNENFLGLQVASDKELFDITYMSALQSNKYGSTLKLNLKGIELNINTSGSISDGKFNGSTDFSILGQTLTLQYSDFDVEKYKNELTNGTYTIEPAHVLQLLKLLNSPDTEPFEDITKIVLHRVQESETESELSLTVDKANEFYCTVDYGSSVKDKKDIGIPTDVASGIINWFRYAELDTITDNLEKAGCHYDLFDIIKILLF